METVFGNKPDIDIQLDNRIPPVLPEPGDNIEKKKRGRPPGLGKGKREIVSAAIPESVLNMNAAALTSATILLIDVVHRTVRKRPVNVNTEMNDALNASLKELCRKYSNILGEYGPELGFLAVLYMVWMQNGEGEKVESERTKE
jgi:hypothetical protein